MTDDAMLRVSDDERRAAQDALRRHHLDGRLTVDELDERSDRADAAVTRADLEALQADLPRLATAPPVPVPPGPVGLRRGTRRFSERVELDAAPDQAFEEVVHLLAPPMAYCGYHLENSSATWLEFVRRRRPVWTILLAIFLFPIGLIALVHRPERRVTVVLEHGHGGGCVVMAHGEAPLPVRQALADLGA